MGAVAKDCPLPAQFLRQAFPESVWQKYRQQAFIPFFDIRPIDMAGPFASALFAERQETAETRIGFAIRWIDQERRSALQIEAAPDNETDARCPGRFMGAHHAGERIPIGNAKGLDA
jgi:hypothetical protein